jgi:hypothetical protein
MTQCYVIHLNANWYQKPVALLGMEALTCELTKDELAALDFEVCGLICDLEIEEASWFYAFEHFTDDPYHLMDKEHYDRRGPVLCGSRPLLRAEGSILRGWFLRPLCKEEEINEQRVCPACLERWKAQQARDAGGNSLARKEQQ